MINQICVVGAGTMGAGIAFASAQHGFPVVLFDLQPEVLRKAENEVIKNLQFLQGKSKITEAESEQIQNRIQYSSNQADCKADLIIEAIVEKLSVKQSLFQTLDALNTEDTLFASNTSSLSISSMQSGIRNPGRVAGLHFFNPAHIMKLVEVVQGKQTSDATIESLMQFCKRLGKTAVHCIDSPGFIVNRVARPYYLEAMYLTEKYNFKPEEVDAALENAGFKMGPFRLMDLIGIDVNLAVSESVYEAFDKAVRFTPSELQRTKLKEGKLGKKTGEGFYQY